MYPGGAKLSNDLPVVRFGKELTDALSEYRPNVADLKERRLVCADEVVEFAEMQSEILCGCLADMARQPQSISLCISANSTTSSERDPLRLSRRHGGFRARK